MRDATDIFDNGNYYIREIQRICQIGKFQTSTQKAFFFFGNNWKQLGSPGRPPNVSRPIDPSLLTRDGSHHPPWAGTTPKAREAKSKTQRCGMYPMYDMCVYVRQDAGQQRNDIHKRSGPSIEKDLNLRFC